MYNFESISPSWTFYLPYLRNGWANWCQAKSKWANWMLRCIGYLWPWHLTLTFDLDLWPWIFKVKLYLGNGRSDCHGTKGTGVDRMPWCETLREWVNYVLCWLGYLWLWIFKVEMYLVNGRPYCHGTKGTGVNRMPWWKWVKMMLCWLGTFDLELWPWMFKVKLYLGNGRPDCHVHMP